MSELDRLIDRAALVDAVTAIFDTVDAKDWDAAERLFTPKLHADFTSLAGGEPAEITNVQLVGGWRVGLHARKESFHLAAHHRVTVDGDTAHVHVKGYAYNALDAELGGAVWEVWGTYEIPFTRTADGWLATGLTFNATRTRGDAAVRTHTLD
ncbi:nuclear transport factor 2 family protein [Kitasatospora viridis]|uniref:SnoaL-like protein n=1 Tax=Kitasatospora viridis TaxID=281105 RepID=A0A561UHA7_9ACTN|nr:nuclear transport factor 2 family protein [Kitasatospora viridis]TWF98749.1 SnoaL-like protein [Kitasatospora viridis]